MKNCKELQPKLIDKVHRARENCYAYDKISRWIQRLRVAHKERVINNRRDEALLEIAGLYGLERREVRAKYWRNFAEKSE